MPLIGDVYEYQRSGERLVVAQIGDDSRGEPYRLDGTAAPHASGPPLHIHPSSEETFEVLSGRLNVRAGAGVRDIGPGEKAVVPAGTPHKFWNETDEKARFSAQLLPALRHASYFEALYPIVGSARVNPLRLAVVLREYRREARFGGPLGWFLAILAPIGRVLGYHA